MSSVITPEGKTLIAQKQALPEVLEIQSVVFAKKAPALIDDCEDTVNWSVDQSGTVALDAIVYYEGITSFKVSGQSATATVEKDLSGSPLDISKKLGIEFWAKGNEARDIQFFIEDSTANRNKWIISVETDGVVLQIILTNPDVDGLADLTDITKIGFEGLPATLELNFDLIRSNLDNDLQAGEIVHTAALTPANSGYINPDAVVYSVLLDSSKGDFEFDWIGWKSTEGTVLAIIQTTTQYKRKTTGAQLGNNFTRNLILDFLGVATLTNITVPAETWQLDFTQRFQLIESDAVKALKTLYGRAAFLGDAFKVSAIPPVVADDCELTTNWVASDGTLELDGAVFNEGAASLKISGQSLDATLTKILTATVDWSSKNGLLVDLLGDSATNIVFFIEDDGANRNQWNIVNQTAWTTHELKLDAPDVDKNADLTKVKKFGLEGLDNGVVYNLDDIRTARLNDFDLAIGESFIEGIRCEESATTYENHLNDYNAVVTPVTVLNPPGAGTRTDGVYLDVHLRGDFNGYTPYITIIVSDAVQNDYIDGNGYQHYVEKIGEILRTTSEQIPASMLTDFRQNTVIETYVLESLMSKIDTLNVNLFNLMLQNWTPVGDSQFGSETIYSTVVTSTGRLIAGGATGIMSYTLLSL